MVDRALLSQSRRGVEDDPAEVVDTEAFSDAATRGDGDARRDLDESLDEETERLGGDVSSVEPVEDPPNPDPL